MPKQLFQRPANLKLSKGAKNNSFGGQPDWGRKKGKPQRIEKPVPVVEKSESGDKK